MTPVASSLGGVAPVGVDGRGAHLEPHPRWASGPGNGLTHDPGGLHARVHHLLQVLGRVPTAHRATGEVDHRVGPVDLGSPVPDGAAVPREVPDTRLQRTRVPAEHHHLVAARRQRSSQDPADLTRSPGDDHLHDASLGSGVRRFAAGSAGSHRSGRMRSVGVTVVVAGRSVRSCSPTPSPSATPTLGRVSQSALGWWPAAPGGSGRVRTIDATAAWGSPSGSRRVAAMSHHSRPRSGARQSAVPQRGPRPGRRGRGQRHRFGWPAQRNRQNGWPDGVEEDPHVVLRLGVGEGRAAADRPGARRLEVVDPEVEVLGGLWRPASAGQTGRDHCSSYSKFRVRCGIRIWAKPAAAGAPGGGGSVADTSTPQQARVEVGERERVGRHHGDGRGSHDGSRVGRHRPSLPPGGGRQGVRYAAVRRPARAPARAGSRRGRSAGPARAACAA